MTVAKIHSLRYNYTNFIYDIDLTDGDLVFGAFGCIDGKDTVARSIDSAQYTCIFELGDFFYVHPTHFQRDGLVADAAEENTARIKIDLIKMNANIQVPIFAVLGNHDGGNAGHGVTDFEGAKAKIQAAVDGVQRYYAEHPDERLPLGDDSRTEKVHLRSRYYLQRFRHPDGRITFVVNLDSSLLPADQAQLAWLEKVVMPLLAQNAEADVLLNEHHSLGITVGERANATSEKKKYPAPLDKDTAGSHHHQVLKALHNINFPVKRCVCVVAHEHTAEVFQTQELQEADLKENLPQITVVSGNGGATSNKKPTEKVFNTPPPGLDFVQSGYGHFRLTLPAGGGTLRLSYVDTTAPTPSWEKVYALHQAGLTTSTQVVQAPEIFKESEAKLYLVIVDCLKEGRFDLIKLLLASKTDYAHDSQLSHDLLDDFFQAPFVQATEVASVETLLQQLEKLIAFFLSPTRSGYCTQFFNEVCFVHFLLRNALTEMRSSRKALKDLDLETYFYPGAVPPRSAQPTFSDEVDEELTADEDARKTPLPEKAAKKTTAPAPKRKHSSETIAAWSTQATVKDFSALKAHVQNAIAKYLQDHLAYNNPEPREYFTEKKSHAHFAQACLAYQLLENASEQDVLPLVKQTLQNARVDLQQLILDTLALNEREIFGYAFNDARSAPTYSASELAYKKALKIAKQWTQDERNSDTLETSAQRIMLDAFFELTPPEKTNSQTYSTLFEESALVNLSRHYIFRPTALVEAEAIFNICFQQLSSLQSDATPWAFQRLLHLGSRHRLFHTACETKTQFEKLKMALFDLFMKAESKADLLGRIQDDTDLKKYFRIDSTTDPSNPQMFASRDTRAPEPIQNLMKLFALFVAYLPSTGSLENIRGQLLDTPHARPHLPVPKPAHHRGSVAGDLGRPLMALQ